MQADFASLHCITEQSEVSPDNLCYEFGGRAFVCEVVEPGSQVRIVYHGLIARSKTDWDIDAAGDRHAIDRNWPNPLRNRCVRGFIKLPLVVIKLLWISASMPSGCTVALNSNNSGSAGGDVVDAFGLAAIAPPIHAALAINTAQRPVIRICCTRNSNTLHSHP